MVGCNMSVCVSRLSSAWHIIRRLLVLTSRVTLHTHEYGGDDAGYSEIMFDGSKYCTIKRGATPLVLMAERKEPLLSIDGKLAMKG